MKKVGNRAKKGLVIAIAAIVLILLVIFGASGYIIDYQWFKEVGYLEVFFKKLVTQTKFFIPAFVIFFAIFFLYIKSIDKKKKSKKLAAVISAVASLFLSTSFVSNIWYEFLVFMNKTSFGIKDPIFSKDIGFHVFTLPFITKLYSLLMMVLFAFALLTVLYGLLNLSVEEQTDGPVEVDEFLRPRQHGEHLKNALSSMAKQLTNLVAVFFILLSGSFLLRNFRLLYSPSGVSFGAGYTDVKVLIPFNYIFAVLCIFTAITIWIGFRKAKKKLIIAGPLSLVVCFVLAGGASILVQSVIVKPNEISKEDKYIQNTIDYTNKAYGLNNITVEEFPVEQNLTRKDIDDNHETISNIPVNDYKPALDIYKQIQGLKSYYTFNDIDIDRYTINGEYRQVFLAARELKSNNVPGQEKSSWINRYLKYTHGYGAAMSPVNEVTSSGQPSLMIKDIPVVSNIDVKIDVPQIYYGELTDDFVIVNTKEKEFDYQTSNDIVETTYSGKGGIRLNWFNRILFAVRERDMNFLLSQALTSNSKILYNRDIVKRVEKIAPFLQYDGDPYLVISGGKLYWMMDAFTISGRYPYSEPFNESGVNYIRNSVKVVVDAYNGTTDFYIADKEDPIIQTYSKIYKTLFKPMDQMPEDLRSHVRYSQTMFDVQANLYRKYHVANARELYNKSDIWAFGTQYYGASGETQDVESAYMIMNLPDTPEEEFIMMKPYTPQGKNNMIAWLAVRCDGDEYGKLLLYEFPSGKTVTGPMQFENLISQDVTISNALNLLNTGTSSQVLRGNTLIIPIEKSLLYVEPIYVRSQNETALPELKKVVVSYKGMTVMENSLEESLNRIFPVEGNGSQRPSTPSTPQTPSGGAQPGSLTTLIQNANTVYMDAQKAIQGGDWATYGSKMKELESLLNQLDQMTGSASVSADAGQKPESTENGE